METDVLLEKTFHFACGIMSTANYLHREKHENTVSKELLLIVIAMNLKIEKLIKEKIAMEFISLSREIIEKMAEIEYLIRLLYATDQITLKINQVLYDELKEINGLTKKFIEEFTSGLSEENLA